MLRRDPHGFGRDLRLSFHTGIGRGSGGEPERSACFWMGFLGEVSQGDLLGIRLGSEAARMDLEGIRGEGSRWDPLGIREGSGMI